MFAIWDGSKIETLGCFKVLETHGGVFRGIWVGKVGLVIV